MATSQTGKAIEQLRRAVLHDGAALTDGELLGRFIEHRDGDAFAALVRRHAAMVWGVCRRLLHHHDAEDAFQAAFIVLVRKAASVVPREMVANWLYGVAHQAALQARRTAARRAAREKQVTAMPEPAVAGQDPCPDLRPLLDQELSRLPDKYRAVIVLCDLEGKARKEVARQLGCPEGTVGSRLARARAMLARRLTQRGAALSGAAVAAVLSREAASAGVPASVVSSAIKAATLVAVGQAAAGAITGTRSAQVISLTEGVLKAMLWNKLKPLVFVIAGAALLGGSFALRPGGGNPGQAQAQQVDRGPAAAPGQALPPFTLEVGKHYQILLPDHKQWPGEQGLVLVQRNFSNGWVEIKTEEGQTAWLNLNQAMQVYLIADPQKWHREAARGAR